MVRSNPDCRVAASHRPQQHACQWQCNLPLCMPSSAHPIHKNHWPGITGTTPNEDNSLKLHGRRWLRAYKKAGSHNAGQCACQEVATKPGPCQEGHSAQNRHIASQFVAAQVQVLQQHNPLVLHISWQWLMKICSS